MEPDPLYHLIKEVFLLVEEGDRRTLRGYDLSIAQANLLWQLQPGGALKMHELSMMLFCDKANITRLVDMLEKKDLVVRQPSSEDRRVVCVRLTRQGEALREETRLAHAHSLEQRLAALPSEQRAQLAELLDRLRATLQSASHSD